MHVKPHETWYPTLTVTKDAVETFFLSKNSLDSTDHQLQRGKKKSQIDLLIVEHILQDCKSLKFLHNGQDPQPQIKSLWRLYNPIHVTNTKYNKK